MPHYGGEIRFRNVKFSYKKRKLVPTHRNSFLGGFYLAVGYAEVLRPGLGQQQCLFRLSHPYSLNQQ
jgi:hypothetical protein